VSGTARWLAAGHAGDPGAGVGVTVMLDRPAVTAAGMAYRPSGQRWQGLASGIVASDLLIALRRRGAQVSVRAPSAISKRQALARR
jgi:hypothetical protein